MVSLADFDRESMLEMFTFEMGQLLEQLEQNILEAESGYNMNSINEIFRIMHTIKGSAAMMMFDTISTTSHAIEDLFYFLREGNPTNVDNSTLTDIVLEGMDFVKNELAKIESGLAADGDGTEMINKIENYLQVLKGGGAKDGKAGATSENAAKEETKATPAADNGLHHYTAKIHFEDGCEMENIRAYTLVHNIENVITNVSHEPEDIIDEEAIAVIRKNGFSIKFDSEKDYKFINDLLMQTVYLKDMDLTEQTEQEEAPATEQAVESQPVPQPEIVAVKQEEAPAPAQPAHAENEPDAAQGTQGAAMGADQQQANKKAPTQHVISVNVSKLDQLLNLMGELVIAEAMVTQNPELEGLELESFHKETRQLQKIIKDVQDNVMSMRMVPLSTTFFKMHRIVRDMCKALNKDVVLEVKGEETEVDKNIAEHISDPLMHIIRNSVDHGIESPEERKKSGKSEKGTVLLEAKSTGGDVLIMITDDGAGLDKDKIMRKAKNNGLLRKPENEYTEKEIHQFIFLPGFSTNEVVTSYSGRGVGMDVVTTNLEVVGGSVLVDSTPGEGSVFTLKIPLTLAIIEGMTVKMGGAKYTIPIISIKQSFKAKKESMFTDPDGNEMIMDRGEVYNVVRLYEFFNVQSDITNIEDGIMIMLENGDQRICLFADELIGEQQVVVKTIPKYIKKIRGISGCTLLGNGDISLIIDVAGLFDK